MYDMMKAKI